MRSDESRILPLLALPLMILAAGCSPVERIQHSADVAVPVAEASIAFDRNGERGSFAAGLADPKTARAITPDDPVRVASISKLAVG